MNKRLSKIYNWNTGWWDSFTSCFAGTLLGIILTFGISGYISEQEQQATERKIQLMAYHDLEKTVNNLQKSMDDKEMLAKLYRDIWTYYPDKMDEMPDSVSTELFNDLLYTQHYPYSPFLKKFDTSLDDWKILSPTTMDLVEHLASNINIIYILEDLIISYKETIQNSVRKNLILYDFEKKEGLDAIFSTTENINALSSIDDTLPISLLMLEECKKIVAEVKKNLNITEEEMEFLQKKKLVNDSYKKFKITETDTVQI